MVFCCLEKCNSLREVSRGILGLSTIKTVRINHLLERADCRTQINVESRVFEENKLPQSIVMFIGQSI
jgi:hypothetical protein